MPLLRMSSSNSTKSRKQSSTASGPRSLTPDDNTEIVIHVYDLLPPSTLSSVLWTIGSSLLHTAVVVDDREYAYGGHARRDVTGVYVTPPGQPPPGATFRCAIRHGKASAAAYTPTSRARIISAIAADFLGTKYNLLTRNCNHFTSALCEALTGRAAPAWINRAAGIGLALPCMVPREWIEVPDVETEEGELVDEHVIAEDVERHEDGQDDGYAEDGADEHTAMLTEGRRDAKRQSWWEHITQNSRMSGDSTRGRDSDERVLVGGQRIRSRSKTPPARIVVLRDTAGREVPPAERAPAPRGKSISSD